jgi:pimeloyl-ACP methyl ester carboxylesterase
MALDAPIDPVAVGLPDGVLGILEAPPESVDSVVEADGIPFFVRTWGDAEAPPLLLLHGVTASSRIWWRIGPALAALLGRRVVAPDQAGHGRTLRWTGRVSFKANAGSIAELARCAGIADRELQVVGHSWGAMTVAWLPSVGLLPDVTVLLDPPALPLAAMASMLDDPVERRYDDPNEAIAAIGGIHATWAYGDVHGKAEALTQLDEDAVRAVLTENGDWDGGLEALADPAARAACFRLIRGEPACGGLIPDDAAERLADRLGRENVMTIARGTHSPMRQRPEATLVALAESLRPPGSPGRLTG